MTSPTTSSSVSNVGQSTSQSINALIGGTKWGGASGTGVSVSYSFPWTTSANAVFSAYNGVGNYSSLNEQNATYHYGLNATQLVAARSALQAWANVANITFSEVAETSSNVGDIRIAWTSATELISGSGTQAWGWAVFPTSNYPKGGDVWLSTTVTDSDWSVGSYNCESLIHELGHALGLKHPFAGTPVLPSSLDSALYTVMSYTDPTNDIFRHITYNTNSTFQTSYVTVQPETPMVLDIAAMQYLYGANTSYHTGDDVYTFGTTTPFFKSIWDAGGNDTISVSNFTQGCVIDLTPGDYSSITILSDALPAGYTGGTTPTYNGTHNLGIAYGCVIENAIGGSGNDTLIGNDSNNSLDGGSGNDTLYGGAGDDTFDWDATASGGNDVFYGGTGNDTYCLSSSLDSVIELAGEGNDTIWTPLSYSLGNLPYVENLRAIGPTGVSLTGNASQNNLIGSSGNDTLRGDAGNDILDGGGGTDVAVFGAASTNYRVVSYNGEIAALTAGSDGRDRLFGIENLQFSDKTIAAGSVATFNPLAYIASYTDLMSSFRANGQAGFDHYIDNGFVEGRQTVFDPLSYLNAYPDLIKAFGSNTTAATTHYINSGYSEGRHIINGLQYIASYPDLIKVFGANAAAGEGHYIHGGYLEGRHAMFDPLSYLNAYPDLMTAFGSNTTAATTHYINSGYFEGRQFIDGLQYIASYSDLIGLFGVNAAAGAAHYIQSGYFEGRHATFDGQSYVMANLDLLAAFGLNSDAGERHYIQNGYREGRETSLSSMKYGTAGDDTLTATAGKDMLDGGKGHDTLTGGTGQDIFVLRAGDGGPTLQLADVITDFQDGTDRLGLAGSLTYENLTIQQGTGTHAADTIISSSGEYLAILNNLLATNINSQDFVHL